MPELPRMPLSTATLQSPSNYPAPGDHLVASSGGFQATRARQEGDGGTRWDLCRSKTYPLVMTNIAIENGHL